MKRRWIVCFALAGLLLTLNASAEDSVALPGTTTPPVQAEQLDTPVPEQEPAPLAAPDARPEQEPAQDAQVEQEPQEEEAPAEPALATTMEYRWFVNQYNNVRGVTVTYYDNVYAVNHGKYGLTPFASVVPEEYFVEDKEGFYALAPIVLDITDAMRVRLYGGDLGQTAMYYGQYCERIRGKGGRVGFSGVHEGIDFVNQAGCDLHAILGGEVTRAGDSNGTVGIYSAEYDITLLYLHCEDIRVRRGDTVQAGDLIACEGRKGSGSRYTHVEMRNGRHTSSSPYRDTKLTSDCPYAVMQQALEVAGSGREAVTYTAALAIERQRAEEEAAAAAAAKAAEEEAERMRIEAEAAARAEEEARRKAEEEQNQEPDVELIDVLPGTTSGYGFGEPTPEATLPPSNP